MKVILNNNCYQIVCEVKSQSEDLPFKKKLMEMDNVKCKRIYLITYFGFVCFITIINSRKF